MSTWAMWSFGLVMIAVLLCALGLSGAQTTTGSAHEEMPAASGIPVQASPPPPLAPSSWERL